MLKVTDARECSLAGSSTFPDALSASGQARDSSRSTAKDLLLVAWTGMEMLLKKVEGCLGGTLAKAPVATVNAIIDIKNVRCQSQSATHL